MNEWPMALLVFSLCMASYCLGGALASRGTVEGKRLVIRATRWGVRAIVLLFAHLD